MKEYYAERNGLLKEKLDIGLTKLLGFFGQTYKYFDNKDYFECAETGVWRTIPYTEDEEQIIAPFLAPSPEIYFANKLQKNQIWPIREYYEYYSEEVLFTVVEILYDNIAIYDCSTSKICKEEPRKEFAEHINNILRLYSEGYYLEPHNGFIMKLPNKALKQQLSYNGEEMSEEVYTQLSTATELYYRFDSNMEVKKKAINILADILEKDREDVKNILNNEYKINKNCHDKLIFGIVNDFNIRHNNDKQIKNYSKVVWYDWMMQYYTSVIITYHKLIKNYTT